MDLINELLDCLREIDYSKFNEDYLNEVLDCRDSISFDTEWCRIYEEIETLKKKQGYTEEEKEEQRKIRKKAFMIVDRNIMSELSDYISDDFGLIYDSFLFDYKDDWLDKLINEYKNQRIPSGEL